MENNTTSYNVTPNGMTNISELRNEISEVFVIGKSGKVSIFSTPTPKKEIFDYVCERAKGQPVLIADSDVSTTATTIETFETPIVKFDTVYQKNGVCINLNNVSMFEIYAGNQRKYRSPDTISVTLVFSSGKTSKINIYSNLKDHFVDQLADEFGGNWISLDTYGGIIFINKRDIVLVDFT